MVDHRLLLITLFWVQVDSPGSGVNHKMNSPFFQIMDKQQSDVKIEGIHIHIIDWKAGNNSVRKSINNHQILLTYRKGRVQQLVVEAPIGDVETNSKDELFYGIDDDDGDDYYFSLPSNCVMSLTSLLIRCA